MPTRSSATPPNTLTTHSPRSRSPPTSPSTAIEPSFNLSTFRIANGYRSLIFARWGISGSCEIVHGWISYLLILILWKHLPYLPLYHIPLYQLEHYLLVVDIQTSTIIIHYLPLILDIRAFSLLRIRKRVIFERHWSVRFFGHMGMREEPVFDVWQSGYRWTKR